MPIRCEIVSEDKMVFQGDADTVILPGAEGEMGILPNHAPLLTTLKLGVITVRAQGRDEHYTVSGGVADVQPEIVTVLATAAENIEEIDVTRAESARRRAEEVLAKGVPHDTDAYLAMEAALKRSNLRLDAVKRYKRGPGRPTRRADE